MEPQRPAAAPHRREFLQLIGLGTLALVAESGFVAGPFAAEEAGQLVPLDKKLAPEWVRALTARGEPEVYRGAETALIGMPVGGLCAGQLYLGGDGKLWHWDIFNQVIGTGDGHYSHPPKPESPLDQGFAIRVEADGKAEDRTLDRAGFPDVSFRGEYPIGKVEYRADGFPVSVTLEAFSPFIPLNVADSSLPATVLHFTVKNTGKAAADVQLAGWLQNAVGRRGDVIGGRRRNRVREAKTHLFLECAAEAAAGGEGAAGRRSSSPTSRARTTATGRSRARPSARGRSTARCPASSRCPATRARGSSTAGSTATTPSARSPRRSSRSSGATSAS